MKRSELSVQLAELLKDWPCIVKGSIRVQVTGIEDYAQNIQQGYIYVLRKGKKFNGKSFLQQAINNGASAVVVEDDTLLDLKLTVPIVWVPNSLQFLSFASAKLRNFPAEALTVIAITGTNGKTTVSHFISQMLQIQGKSCIVIGTNGVFLNGERWLTSYESLTTLQAKQLQEIFQMAVRQGVGYAILEASSMGLAHHRLDDCAIDIGIFLNLSAEHIEDHGSLENYKKAKQRLAVLAKNVVLNGDDPFSRSVGINLKKKTMLFGSKGRVDMQWQLLTESEGHSTCCLQYKGEEHILILPFVGEFQIQNIMAAFAALYVLNFDIAQLIPGCLHLRLPEGRMQEVENDQGLRIIIDYAHTPAALKAVLQALKQERVRLVFSCGGERDKDKRRKMGTIASTYAYKIYLTTDNARSEKPAEINAQIKAGFYSEQLYEEIEDRAQAIEKAIREARQGDVVLIAGKGHEQTQTIGSTTIPFSDKACAENALQIKGTAE
ncbi:UDP-N-acetylmuramoyl-L-alanyl-D-glutamate--2,6-diaminopimelate ligase [Metasolibacillus sp. FSL K6-0083]|uniref:UDP-N-acetylmuramoyl-L-alanyl-D-glutamate--2, 6-diaminopimelate ligase n=1 Tax=Metasolibacillus sp. FSL K6-0083 TaxID=2921416 RepID=UPI003159DE35